MIIVVPATNALNKPPPEVIVATVGLLLVHTPVNELVRVVVNPKQMLLTPPIAGGVGLTATVNDSAAPGQEFAVGVTEITPCIWLKVLLVPVKAAILPVPEAASPIAVLSFVHA